MSKGLFQSKALFPVGLLLCCSCATSSLSVQSNPPEADVYVASLGNETPQLVGKTPLSVTSTQLKQKYGASGPFSVELKKEGFQPVRTIVTDLSAMDLNLRLELAPDLSYEQIESLNDSIDLLFEGQRLARAGRLKDAIDQLKIVERNRPQLAASYELEGGIYYIQKRFKESLDAYTTASKLDPKSPNSIKMRDLLESRLGVVTQQPAGAAQSARSTP